MERIAGISFLKFVFEVKSFFSRSQLDLQFKKIKQYFVNRHKPVHCHGLESTLKIVKNMLQYNFKKCINCSELQTRGRFRSKWSVYI